MMNNPLRRWYGTGRKRRILRLVALIFVGLSALISSTVWFADQWFGWQARGQVYTDKTQLTPSRFGLLLGTAKYHPSGTLNPFYQARIAAAAELYHDGLLEFILASGNHNPPFYNEPRMMMQDLIQLGVPEAAILQDGEGTRTLNSVIRLKTEYHQDHVIIISQQFHIERALYQAKAVGIDAQGFVAVDAPPNWHWRVRVREVLARLYALVEIHLLRRADLPAA
ncbi:YdcF family protein [Salinispirillum sp. LH 10-3-1]|uniref:YdcF family protein n=1 Tax=Salinispirillum sp. LH 10-3-1 TaxID=2952525 RepID=A0AB38YCT7_9GAMM